MKIGIIGAENSHTAAIARTINVAKQVKGFTVDYLWGETAEAAKIAAEKGQIPNIVETPKQMLDSVDAVIVDHRHAKHHLKAVLPFVERGIPAFVDKPFCFRSDEGKEFLKVARKNKAPVTSFSTVTLQRSFKRFVGKMGDIGDILVGVTYGPCDLRSKHGGVFFYGIHQVAMALSGFGINVSSVLMTANGNGATGQLLYSDGKIVTMNFLKEGCRRGFTMGALGSTSFCQDVIKFDSNPYLTGIKLFTNMFKTRQEPLTRQEILKPILVLEALARSLKSRKIEKVGR